MQLASAELVAVPVKGIPKQLPTQTGSPHRNKHDKRDRSRPLDRLSNPWVRPHGRSLACNRRCLGNPGDVETVAITSRVVPWSGAPAASAARSNSPLPQLPAYPPSVTTPDATPEPVQSASKAAAAAAGSGTLATDGTGLLAGDPWLKPYEHGLRQRHTNYVRTLKLLAEHDGSLLKFARGHQYFGFTRGRDVPHDPANKATGEDLLGEAGIWYREWAPGARGLSLIGEFNNWDRAATPMVRDGFGVWSVFLPDGVYAHKLKHEGRVKVHVSSDTGDQDRIPAYIRRVVFEADGTNATGQLWLPPSKFEWKHPAPVSHAVPRIYECHVGMATEHERVGTFAEFERDVLPRVRRGGYNCIQLMAVQEHPYYGSFGYHVSNFFAVSSRFGTPEDFKRLVDIAHGMGIRVLLDLVHSHSVKNTVEGLACFDGTDHQYFHAGGRGLHPAWDSMLFDYSKPEVLRLLLSNVRYWLEEFHVDGFRFDGVTSMLYLDHGLGKTFGSYDDYFGANIDEDAGVFLRLANQVAHETKHDAITVAEDVSGMVGIARPIAEGGFGFDYRLAMGIPDYWIKILKERRDEDWSMGDLFHTLTNRRAAEKHIAYAESHDQAMVGDKTLAFRLMDAEMYGKMNKQSQSLIIDRGIALHKLIRLLTFMLGGEGWLNFMGNEFGHPEWVDFPRAGNGNSYKHARRQWSLAENPDLRYRELGAFDLALHELDQRFGVLASPPAKLMQCYEHEKRIVVERAGLVMAVNLHPSISSPNWRVGIPTTGDYNSVLNTDDPEFGGHGLVVSGQVYPEQPVSWDDMKQSVQIYVPARSGQVLARGQ